MLDNIHDRGAKKWTAMMLPEHVVSLRKYDLDNKKIEMPQLDDFELDLIANEIERAYKGKKTIKLTYWRDGYLADDYGVIIQIDIPNKSITIDDPFGTNRYPFDEIVVVALID